MSLRIVPQFRRFPIMTTLRAMYSSESNKSGAIKEAGGAFAKREAAQEDQYFRKLQQEQLKNLKSHLDDEVGHHEKEIKHHKEAIERIKQKAKDLESKK